jgi:pyruvate dehydrogenase E2 component (dihydrolipoamide acetyltransferase)
MAEMVMPRLSDTMEEGTILRWLKRDGEHVARGEELVEIETDKANMIYESDQEGALQIVAREGDTLAVGETIAHIGAAPDGAAGANGEVAAQAIEEQPATPPLAAAPTGKDSGNGPPPASKSDGERVKASPVARRVAEESGVDLHALSGTGPGGRIVKADVQAAGMDRGQPTAADTGRAPTPAGTGQEPAGTEQQPAAAGTGSGQESVAGAKGETTTVELSRTQRAIARRMAESKATIPDFTLNIEIDMEECVALRAELKRLAQQAAPNQPGSPTYNDMVVKACALALREHPRANGSYRDGHFELHSRVNVGVAVASDDALVVPTVFDADVKSLGEIARETRALAERVRDATITPPELGGGTFTVSNLGMYGVRSFAAIINPPQAAILSVGAMEPRAVVWKGASVGGTSRGEASRGEAASLGEGETGEILARHTMAVTLACDHRILYGADAARFLARIRELLEQPAALTL